MTQNRTYYDEAQMLPNEGATARHTNPPTPREELFRIISTGKSPHMQKDAEFWEPKGMAEILVTNGYAFYA